MVVGVDVAEACVLRKVDEEKMKEGEEAKGPKNSAIGSKAERSSRCVFWFSKKNILYALIFHIVINKTERKKKVLDPIYKKHRLDIVR